MRYTLLILSVCFWSAANSQKSTELLKASEHLLAFNSYWLDIEFTEDPLISFKDENARITFHLHQVIGQLEKNVPEERGKALVKNQLIEELRSYADRGVFPINTLYLERSPYFIDDYGTACAVGHLMIESGHEKLAKQVQLEHNNDFIKDIRTPGVVEWAVEHGFSLAELALIQPPAYPPPNILTGLSNGVNGTVSHVVTDPYSGRTYLSGDFTEIDGAIPCIGGFAFWKNEEYTCLNSKPPGAIRDNNYYNNGSRILAGSFEMDDGLTPLVIYEYPDGTWESVNIPGRESATATNVYGYFDRIRVTLAADGESEATEFWNHWVDDNNMEVWTHVFTVQGEIYTFDGGFNKIYLGGDFDSIINHITGDTIPTSNLLSISFQNESEPAIESIASEYLPDEIRAIYWHSSNIIYIGGGCDTIYPNTYLARMQNGVVQPLLFEEQEYNLPNESVVHAIQHYYDGYLILGGDLQLYGIPGRNLARYDLLDGGYFAPIATLDSTVLHIDNRFGDIFLGGHFTQNGQSFELPHIARIGNSTSLLELTAIPYVISPNPASNFINISFNEQVNTIESISVLSLDGKVHPAQYGFANNSLRLDLNNLSPGVYVYRILLDKGQVNGRFVKE